MVPVLYTAAVLLNRRDPWFDEAMLVYNLLAERLSLTAPQPFFEQAAPLGYVALTRAILSLGISADPILSLRITSLVVFLAGALALFGLVWRHGGRPFHLVVLAALFLSGGLTWSYSSEIKHYGTDFTATTLMLVAGTGLLKSNQLRASLIFVVAAFASALLSFLTPVVLCSVLAAIVLMRALDARRSDGIASSPEASPRVLTAGLVVAAGAALAAAAAVHVLVNTKLAYFQRAAYHAIYEARTFDFSAPFIDNLRILIRLPGLLIDVLGFQTVDATLRELISNGKVVSLLGFVGASAFILAMAILSYRRIPFFVLTLTAFAVIAVTLNVIGQLPIDQSRHFLFILPVSLPVFAVGLSEAADRLGVLLRSRRAVQAALVVVLVTTSAWRTTMAFKARSQEVSPLLAEIVSRNPEAPIWAYHGAQPAIAVLAPPSLRFVGLFDFTSGEEAWMERGGGALILSDAPQPWHPNPAYPATIGPIAAGYDALWLLFAHDWIEPSHAPYLETASSAVGPCALAKKANDSALYLCTRRTP